MNEYLYIYIFLIYLVLLIFFAFSNYKDFDKLSTLNCNFFVNMDLFYLTIIIFYFSLYSYSCKIACNIINCINISITYYSFTQFIKIYNDCIYDLKYIYIFIILCYISSVLINILYLFFIINYFCKLKKKDPTNIPLL